MPSPLEKLLEIESTIDADFRTRIPDAVCRALRLKPNDRVVYRIDNDGRVRVENASRPATATAPRSEMPPLLGLLAGLMAGEKYNAQKIDPSLMSSLQDLMNSTTAPVKPRDETIK